MYTAKYILFFLLTSVFLSNVACSEPIVSIKYTNYKITGDNVKQVKQAILASGLQDGNGNVFAAKTSPVFTWKYNFTATEISCAIKSVDVEVQITYHLPELETKNILQEEDKAEWWRYADATFRHEKGHAALSIATAQEIEMAAMNIPPKANCGEVARTANMLISNILSRLERNNVEYDTQTAHGEKHGAVLVTKN